MKHENEKTTGGTAESIDSSKSFNAFQFMMDSRKKVIGSNSPGKSTSPTTSRGDAQTKEVRSKRKLFLEKWAAKKGGDVNKEKELQREKTVKTVLDKRRNKFKKMLQNKKNAKSRRTISYDYHEKRMTCSSDSEESPLQNNGCPKKKSRGRPSAKNSAVKIVNSEDENFLEKLSSPLKKKNNMYSYLKKSPDDDDDDDDVGSGNETPKKLLNHSDNSAKDNSVNGRIKRFRQVNKGKRQEAIQSSDESSDNLSSESDSDSSFVLNEKSKKNRKSINNIVSVQIEHFGKKIVSPIKIINIRSPKTMKCVKNLKSKDVDDPPCKKVKLAPLFTKSLPKPMIDPNILKARQEFLYSTSSDTSDKLKRNSPKCEVELKEFPVVIHEQQIPSEDNPLFYVWNLPILTETYNDTFDCVNDGLDFKEFRDYKIFNSQLKTFKECYEHCIFNSLTSYDNMKEGLEEIKETYPKFPIYKIFKQIHSKYRECENNKSENDVCQNRTIIIDDDSNGCSEKTEKTYNPVNSNMLWTEKYKPLHSDEIIGNFKSIELLKKWLLSWNERRQEMMGSVLKNGQDSDSSDDFWCSDSESNQSMRVLNNAYIVTGPSGSGKTSAIYAIANELDMNVLEVNASSKRTGKKMFIELKEATQSHKVMTGKKVEIQMKKKNVDKCTRKKVKKKNSIKVINKQSNVDSLSQKSNSDQTNKMSIILVEDADIVFDEDDGFIPALTQIVHSSKRPVIIVTSDLNCRHLKKFVTDSNVVKFHELSGKIIGPWLDLVIFAECNKFIPGFSQFFVDFFKGNMRRTILHLQSWILGCKNNKCINDSSTTECIYDYLQNGYKSTNTPEYKDDESNFEWNKNLEAGKVLSEQGLSVLENVVDICRKEQIRWDILKLHNSIYLGENESDVKIDKVFDKLDTLSTIQFILSSENTIIDTETLLPRWSRFSDSLSENESLEYYRNDFNFDLCQNIIEHQNDLQNQKLNANVYDVFSADYLEKKRIKKQHGVYSQLCEAIPINFRMNRRSLSLDYMPSLRSICRFEKSRCDTNVKRNNRFYHYLSSLNVNAKETIFDDACLVFSVLNDK